MVGEPVHRALCPHTTFDFYIPPRLDDLKNEGGPFLYRWGWGQPNRSKAIDTSSPALQMRETNSDPAFRAKDPA